MKAQKLSASDQVVARPTEIKIQGETEVAKMKQGRPAVELFSFQCSCGLSSFGIWAQLPNSTWHLSPPTGIKPTFPVSKGKFSTTKPPGMSPPLCFLYVIFIHLKIFVNFPCNFFDSFIAGVCSLIYTYVGIFQFSFLYLFLVSFHYSQKRQSIVKAYFVT